MMKRFSTTAIATVVVAMLAAAAPGVSFAWRERERALVCTFDVAAGDVAAVNRRLLPALLAQTDVLSVMPGLSLEEAFLASAPDQR